MSGETMRKITSVLTLAVALSVPAVSRAQSPALVPIQGQLLDSSGNPLTTAANLKVALYETETGGTAFYEETENVPLGNDGRFFKSVGSLNALDLSVFANRSEIWVGLTVDNDPEMVPRFRLGTSPYAAYAARAGRADEATTLEGASASDFALSSHTHPWTDITAVPADLADGDDIRSQAQIESFARGVCYDTPVELATAVPAWDQNASDDITSATQFQGDVSGTASTIQIVTSAVGSAEIADGSVGALDIGTNAVTLVKMADSSVSSAEVVNNSLTADDLAVNSVTASEIATGAVGALEIATNAVGSAEIANDAVGPTELNGSAIFTTPGVTNVATVDMTSANFVTLASRSITVPGPGTILALATWEHRVLSGTTDTFSEYILTTSASGTTGNLTETFWSTLDIDVQYISDTHFATFTRTTAGAVTVYLRGRTENDLTTFRAYNVRLTLLFIPS